MSDWTTEEDATLRNLVAAGVTARRISNELGTRSRNAVIAYCHRHGLKLASTRKPTRTRPPAKPRTQAANRPGRPRLSLGARPHAKAAPPPPEPAMSEPAVRRVAFLDLTPEDCRWPLSDPQHADFAFCGCPRHPGLPYCTAHAMLAYQPVTYRASLRERVAA